MRTIVLAALALAVLPQLTGAVPYRAQQTVSVQIRCADGRIASSEVAPDPVELAIGALAASRGLALLISSLLMLSG